MSVAVCLPGIVGTTPLIVEAFEPMAKGHAERLLPMIAGTLAEADIGYVDVTRLAVTLGPGGFTGLRAGIAAVRGLALATGLPVVGMSSLAVMARGAVRELGHLGTTQSLAVIVDARRDEVYLQLFTADGQTELGAAQLATLEQAVNLLPAGDVVAVGSGAAFVVAMAGRNDVVVEFSNLLPRASDLVVVAAQLQPLMQVTPNYLRAADAKVQTANVLPRMA